MLSKIKIFQFIFLVALFSMALVSCGDEKKEEEKPEAESEKIDYNDPRFILTVAQKKYGEEVAEIRKGNFLPETSDFGVAVGLEISSDTSWGIQFVYCDYSNGVLNEVFRTEQLDGSFNESKLKPVKIEGYDRDFLYYNSKEYYMSHAGGDVYAYLLDFKERKTYYAHFFSYEETPTSLYLSKNINNSAVRNFFLSEFNAIFPEFKLTDRDFSL